MQKCCIPYIPCRYLLLGTTVNNDIDSFKLFNKAVTSTVC